MVYRFFNCKLSAANVLVDVFAGETVRNGRRRRRRRY